MRRVLILTETYAPEIGGGETQARDLAEGLVALGMQVTLLTRRSRRDSPRSEVIHGVAVERRGPAGRGQTKKWALLAALVPALWSRARTADAVVVCGFRILGIAAVPICRRLGVPCLLKADSQGELSGAFFERGLRELGLTRESWPLRALLARRRRLLARADRFVAVSSTIATELTQHGVAAERVLRIPNGVDTGRFAPATPNERRALRRRLQLPEAARIVVYAGRLVRYKGLPELLEAWPRVRAGRPDAHLVLVGAGGLDVDACEDELRVRARELGLEECVHFTGAVADVSDYLRAADVFALPSRNEAFGLAAVEALASGLALVSTRCGGLRDVVRHEETGIVVEPEAHSLGDGIARLLDDAALRRRLGDAGRQEAIERYSIRSVVSRYAAAVAELGAGGPGRKA